MSKRSEAARTMGRAKTPKKTIAVRENLKQARAVLDKLRKRGRRKCK